SAFTKSPIDRMTSELEISPLSPPLEMEASFHLLFFQHPLPMWVVDAKTLEFLVVNNAAVRKYGYSREEFLAMTMDQIATPEAESAEESDAADSMRNSWSDGASASW